MEVDVFFSDDSAGSNNREDRAFYNTKSSQKSGSRIEDTGSREFAGWQYWVALSCVVGATGIAAQSVFF